MTNRLDCDLAILGGGLAGSLIALAIAARRPEIQLLLVERDGVIGGNHIWSFFDDDVAAGDHWLVDPLVTHRWPQGHEVRFPGHRRRLDTPYNSIASTRLDTHVRAVLGEAVLTGATVSGVTPTSVTLADGRTIAAGAVIDARGAGDLSALRCGWQKFVGHALRLDAPHGIDRPVIMDAMVDQIDGYRFVYLLPFDAETIFVEDTYYSDSPDLDVAEVRTRIATYAARRQWNVTATTREETGVLPVVIAGQFDRLWPESDRTGRIGARAGAFHAMTGYSLPDAVRTASALPKLVGRADLPRRLRDGAAASWRRQRFYRMLGAMLFRAADPGARYRIFDRFYGLAPGLIARFYAGRSNSVDKLRILSGKPPVSVRRAIAALSKLDWK